MIYPENKERQEKKDKAKDQHLILDGTVNLDYSDEDQVPRVKGLVELLSQYFRNNPNQNL